MTLAAHNLSLTRGHRRVLRDVSARLEPGTITAILGPNGAGKSSLLMALAGLLQGETGEVTLDDKDVGAMAARERARAIGYLPQDGDIAWDVAVEALVKLGRMPHGDGLGEPVEAALAALDLGELRKRPVSQLSGGEKARVLLARVLAGTPRWILADEPLAALDIAHQMRLIAQFARSTRDGAGVVLVLHDLSIAMNHADRVLVLKDGMLAADGAPRDALTPELVEDVWGARIDWVEKEGRYALVTHNRI